jgi:apolipoprotein N-acyltransferase
MGKTLTIARTAPQPVTGPGSFAGAAASTGGGAWKARLALALASAALLYASFFPLNWGFLGWVAAVPLLAVVLEERVRWPGFYAWVCGLAFAVPALQWVRLASPPMYATWIGLALFVSLHFLFFAWLTRWLVLRAGVPLLAAAPVVWTVLEWGRAHFDIGFAWYFLGHTQHEALPLIQSADLFGAYGLSVLVMAANVLVYEVIRALLAARAGRGGPGRGRRLAWTAAVVAGLVAADLAYGLARMSPGDFPVGPTLALLQGNVPQEIRNDPAENRQQALHFIALADEAARHRPDLIVWPETSVPGGWWQVRDARADQISPDWHEAAAATTQLARDMAGRWGTNLLVGMNGVTLTAAGEERSNTAVLICAKGWDTGRYDKMYCIPFGEYIPLKEVLPFLRWFSPYEDEYSVTPGRRATVFELETARRTYRFATLICYEDSVPHLPPVFLKAGSGPLGAPAAPEFFINISNDGWFKGSEEHEQHLVAARFRAVECRRAVARAVNMGVSCVIDGDGRVRDLPGPTWSSSKAVAAAVVAVVPLDTRESFYVAAGDTPLLLAGLACAGWGLASFGFRRLRRGASAVPAVG